MLNWRWFHADFMRTALLAPGRSTRASASPANRRRSPDLAARGRGRGRRQESLRLAAPETSETDEGRSVLARGRGAALLPLHDGGRANTHQTRDRRLAE